MKSLKMLHDKDMGHFRPTKPTNGPPTNESNKQTNESTNKPTNEPNKSNNRTFSFKT